MLLFLKESFRNIQQTGAIAASSPQLARTMMRVIDFRQSLSIVELGAGTGSITRQLLRRMNDRSRLRSFEINPVLTTRLERLSDPRLDIFQAGAESVNRYCPLYSVDYIVSGLPLANMSYAQKSAILDASLAVLKPGGTYIQFQYSLNDRPLLQQRFREVRWSFTWMNLPPAFVYYAKK